MSIQPHTHKVVDVNVAFRAFKYSFSQNEISIIKHANACAFTHCYLPFMLERTLFEREYFHNIGTQHLAVK